MARVSVPASQSPETPRIRRPTATEVLDVTIAGEALTRTSPVAPPATYARRARISEVTLGYAMLAPALLLLLAFELFPILYGIYISPATGD